ncbi:MAG: Fe-S cluster assembly protein SufB, partial [Actinomycetota bacterium]|nr:Fe-S cluster assembly protein SufB [Actinomycetota bacterium]
MATQAQDPILAENEAVRQLKEGYKYGWSDATNYVEKPQRGLSHDVIDQISDRKGEPDWMRAYRHKALNYFLARPMPKWGADLTGIDFDNIYYYIKPTNLVKNWEDMPAEIRDTWDKLGIPEAEKSYLGGVSAQYESEVVYHSTKKELDDMGVIFTDM